MDKKKEDNIAAYILDFLARFPVSDSGIVHYGKTDNVPDMAKIVIVPAFSNFDITVLPQIPFIIIDDTPILYGDSKIERQNGRIIVYADIFASSFFLLSRYEEILKPECRDKYGRFCAKDSIVFQQGYGYRPLVDEYGILLRKWLREIGVHISIEKEGFSKIWLTHDVDIAYRFARFETVCKQFIKNLIRYNYCASPLKKYFNEQYDDNFCTFSKVMDYDNKLKQYLADKVPVECAYFFLTAGSILNAKYYNFFAGKIKRLMKTIVLSGAKLGLHISHEGGIDPGKIYKEALRIKKQTAADFILSRHHYLRWREPEDVTYMEEAGISDDFTLSYADCPGFRVGTCHPYRFINPRTKELTNITIHPLQIMEVSFAYMTIQNSAAFDICKKIIDSVYRHNGELILLWHNDYFLGDLSWEEKLYEQIMEYIVFMKANKNV